MKLREILRWKERDKAAETVDQATMDANKKTIETMVQDIAKKKAMPKAGRRSFMRPTPGPADSAGDASDGSR